MLSTEDLIKKITRSPEDATLTIFNEYGEAVTATKIVTLAHVKDKVRIRWTFDQPVTTISPLTAAFIHRGRSVWTAFAIRPVYFSDSTEVEITYA